MERAFHIRFRVLTLAVVVFCTALLGSMGTVAAVDLIPISGLSPYPDGGDPNDPLAVTECNGGAQIGLLYRNSESEPHLRVNPTDADNMIAVWHQDRWSNGSAQGIGAAYTMDGGVTWTSVNIPFTHCSGGMPGTGGDFERASDPWLSYGADGAAYCMALVSDESTSRNGMVVAKSTDGGQTWSTPVVIKACEARGVKAHSHFHDKNTLTADPYDPNLVYATWTLFRNNSYALLVSRSTDGGQTWGPARPVNKKDIVAKHTGVYFRQGAQIVVLPDGTLLDVFFRIVFSKKLGFYNVEQAIFRSRDHGKHWERLDTSISFVFSTGGYDYVMNIFVRDAGTIPSVAVDRNNGNVYVVWQDGRFSEYGTSSVVISKSTDGGDTWSEPYPVHPIDDPLAQRFLPCVAVADDGTIGVLYYDFRNWDPFTDTELKTDVHLVTLDPDLNILDEQTFTDTSFDMRQMVITGSSGYFPGDYVGLEAAGNDFVAAFTVSNNLGLPVDYPQDNSILQVDTHNRQDIVFGRVERMSSQVDLTRSTLSSGGDVDAPSGYTYALRPNVPNPFNPETTIGFDLAQPQAVRLEIFDIKGRVVRTLLQGQQFPAGTHEATWDGRNNAGQITASGVYFYRLRAGNFVETRRMVLMK
jgi:hypothetical protein